MHLSPFGLKPTKHISTWGGLQIAHRSLVWEYLRAIGEGLNPVTTIAADINAWRVQIGIPGIFEVSP